MIKIVAEIAASHNGSLQRALDTIKAAKDAGADAVKFQTWTPGTMDCGNRTIEGGPWAGRKLSDLYAEAHTPWEWHQALIAKAQECGLEWWSTPFDLPSIRFLESLGCPRYKIASFEITDLELIEAAANTGKPVIISTGMAADFEISRALCAAKYSPHITLLKCTSAYPADMDFDMVTMPMLRGLANAVGLSDHTFGTIIPVMGVAMGAEMIERHITLGGHGPDDGFASRPKEFAEMVQAVRKAETAMGNLRFGVKPSEYAQAKLRRSLWVVKPLKEGEVITADHIRTARPAEGLPCDFHRVVIGRLASMDIEAGTPLTMEML